MTLLNISGLSHHYAHGGFNGKHQHQAVLNNVSLTLKSGETVALLGRSGCGKSTLARLLVGLESPAQGNISWRGEPLAKLNRAQRKAFRRDIQMVFQDSISAVNPRKTVREIDLAVLAKRLEDQQRSRDPQLQVVTNKAIELKGHKMQQLDSIISAKGQTAYSSVILGNVGNQLLTMQITLPADDQQKAQTTAENIINTLVIQ